MLKVNGLPAMAAVHLAKTVNAGRDVSLFMFALHSVQSHKGARRGKTRNVPL
jgi:hypothetical protein